jgi:hypothetical protein
MLVALVGVGCARDQSEPFLGVRLGMTPRDVRERFQPGGEGGWTTTVGGSADDTVLAWKAREPDTCRAPASGCARVPTGRFEFHLGMLVAMRALVREAAPPPERVEATPKTVTVRRPGPGGTEVTVLARDCPTHHDEAERLAAQAR